MKLKTLVAAGLLAGCTGTPTGGGGGDGGADALATTGGGQQSGSRIKIVNFTTADGLIISNPNLFHDTQLDLDCQFATAADGVLRCLPTTGANIYPAYTDAACTLPVGYTSACTGGQPPKYVYQFVTQTTCPAPYAITVYTVGAPVTTLYAKSGASCVSSALPAGYNVYALSAPLPPAMFAAATLAVSN